MTSIDKTSPYFDKCAKCGGSGTYYGYTGLALGPCFSCKGKGGEIRATTNAERAKRREQVSARKASAAERNLEAFGTQYADELAWLISRAEGFPFAASMLDAVRKYGDLTEKQLTAVQSCVWKDLVRAEERATAAIERENAAPVVESDKLMSALSAAKASGLKKPKLRYDGFAVSMAPEHGKNAGALYLKGDNAHGGAYLGKIIGGKLYASRDAASIPNLVDTIAAAMADPVETARAYARKTGRCSCCDRLLTDPASVAAGIGPICASNFGF